MTKFLTVAATLCFAFTGSIGQAAQPKCTTGTLAYVDGEINNNAVAFAGPLPVTLGVAELRIATKGRGRTRKLTCALSGIPNADVGRDDQLDHQFDHRIVCDDFEQSEISLNSRFIGVAPLKPKLETKLCRGDVQSSFQEISTPDSGEATKGVFRGVYEAEIFIQGCINAAPDYPQDMQINMAVDGYVCLED